MSGPLDAQLRSSLRRSEEIVKSLDNLEPGLRLEAKSTALSELEASLALQHHARYQGNVARYGSVEGFRSREMVVIAAEAALTNEQYDLAREKVQEFFLSKPPRDQFFARCLFVNASCDAQKTTELELNGSKAVRQQLKAFAHIVDALDIAKVHSPRYDFLVYNASVYFWNIARPMLREGCGRFAAPSMAIVCDALEAINDKDCPWRISFLVALSRAEDDASDPSAAAGRLIKALELATKLLEKASEEDAKAQAAVEAADVKLKYAQKMLRCAQDGKAMEPEQSVEPSGAVAKGKGKKGASQLTTDMNLKSEAQKIPTMEEATITLQDAEVTRSSALAIFDKTTAMRKIESRRQEGILLQCIHIGRLGNSNADAKKAMEIASGVLSSENQGVRGKVMLTLQKVRSRMIEGTTALGELKVALEVVDPKGTAAAAAALGVRDGKSSDLEDAKSSSPPALKASELELVVDIGRAALLLAASLGRDMYELIIELDSLARFCCGRAMNAKDTQPSSAVKLDYLKCQLMVREFETCVAVSSTELLSGAVKKESGTKLAQYSMTLYATGGGGGSRGSSRDGMEGSAPKTKRSATEHLADFAANLASEPLLDKLPTKRLDALRLKQHVEALKVLERALMACERLTENIEQEAKETGVSDRFDPGAVPLATEGCILVWNIAKPLLQTHLRKHVHRALGLSAQFLATVGSPLQKLRVMLHYELARCEIATDFLAKAAEHFAAARLCDYGYIDKTEAMPQPRSDGLMQDLVKELGNAKLHLEEEGKGVNEAMQTVADVRSDEVEDLNGEGKVSGTGNKVAVDMDENERRRYLDRAILPAEDKLNLKKSIYEEPEKSEEKALLLIEQAKEVTSAQLQQTLLAQAASLLQEASEESFIANNMSTLDRKNAPQSDVDAILKYADASADGRPRALQQSASTNSVSSKKDSKGIAESNAIDWSLIPPPEPDEKLRATLWSDLLDLIWTKSRAVPLVHKAAKFLLSTTWNPERYAPFVVMQVNAQYTLGQTFVALVQSTPDGIMVPMPPDPDTGRVEDPSIAEEQLSDEEKEWRAGVAEKLRDLGVERDNCPEFVKDYKKRCIGAIMGGLRRALRLATDLRDPDAVPPDFLAGVQAPLLNKNSVAHTYLVENGVVMLWNLHLPAVLRGEFSAVTDDYLSALELSERALVLVNSGDTALYASVSEALARIYHARERYDESETICRRAMTRCRAMQAKMHAKLRAAMIAQKLTTAGPLPSIGGNLAGKGKGGKEGGKDKKSDLSAFNGPLVYTFDPSAEPPSFDEAGARSAANAVHFDVITLLEEIAHMPPSEDGKPAPGQAELLSAIEKMAADQLAAQKAYREAALVAAHKVHVFALKNGGGSVGTLEAAIELPKIIIEARSSLSREEDEELLEMRTELWVCLASEALKQNNARLAQRCCKSAMDVIGPGPSKELMRRVPIRVWRWWSVAERLWAKAVAAMISPSEQEKQTQDKLRCAAMEHLLAAARASLKAGKQFCQGLVLAAALEFWNVALPMMSSPAARASLLTFVEGLLDSLMKARELDRVSGDDGDNDVDDAADDDKNQGADSQDGLLRMQLFVLLFECLADAQRWMDGLKRVNLSFPHVPKSLQRPLWQWKVVFMSKLGRSALDGMAKMKESDPVMQARVWSALGHASTDKRQQLMSHTKALEMLEKDGRPERAEFLVEFAEWCLSVSLPRLDAENALEGALDVLLDIDESHFAAVIDAQTAAADDAALAIEGTASRGQSARSDARSSRGGDGRTSTSAGGARSVKSSGARSVRSAGSTRSQGARSSVGGSREIHKALPVDLLGASLDAGQLEVIVRCLSMLSSLARTSRKRRERALQAAYYCERCVTLAIRTANLSKAVAAYSETDLVDDTFRNAASSALGLDPKEPLSLANFCQVITCVIEASPGMQPTFPRSDIVKDTDTTPFPYDSDSLPGAPYFSMPKSFPEWSRWIPTFELVSALQQVPADLQAFVPSPASFVKMPVTIYHISALTRGLCQEGCHLQALAPTSLAELAVRLAVVPALPPLVTLTAMRSAAVRFSLGDTAGGRKCLKNAPRIGLDESEASLYLDEVDLIEEQKKSIASNRKRQISTAAGLDEKSQEVNINDINEDQEKNKTWKISKFEIRHIWAALARECVGAAYLLLRPALEYLHHATRHNDAFDDSANEAECSLVRAMIASKQGQTDDASQYILRAQLSWIESPNCSVAKGVNWAESVVAFSRLLRSIGDTTEAERALTETAEVLRSRLRQAFSRNPQESELAGETPVQAADAFKIVASDLADLAAEDAILRLARSSGSSGGTRKEALNVFSDRSKMVTTLYEEILDALKHVGPSLSLAKALRNFAAIQRRLALADAEDKGMPTVAREKLDFELGTLNSAEECLKVLIRSHVPPFEQLQFSPGRLQVPGTDDAISEQDNQKPHVSVWPSPVALALRSTEALSVPLERILGWIHITSGQVRVKLGLLKGEHQSCQQAKRLYYQNVTDIVERWIDATAPPAVPADIQLSVRHLERALLHCAGAERLLRASPPSHAYAGVSAGEALVLLAMQKGLLDEVWIASPGEGARSARRTILGLNIQSSLHGSASMESIGKDKKGKKVVTSESEPSKLSLASRLSSYYETSERSDLAWQARTRLEAAAAAAVQAEDWDAVGHAAYNLIELTGCMEPATGAQWLLLHQSCCARKFLLGVLSKALEPDSRLALQLNQLSTICPIGGFAVGTSAVAAEMEMAELDAFGRPLEHPAVERTRRTLIDKRYSTAWPRLDLSRSVPSTLRALPTTVHALCIQISPNKDAVYIALVGRGSLDVASAEAPDPEASTKAPVIWKYGLAPDKYERLVKLKREFSQWKAEVSRFLIKYADDLGEDGDFFVGGVSLSVLLGDELAAAIRKKNAFPASQENEEPSVEASEAIAAVQACTATMAAALNIAEQSYKRDSLEKNLLSLSAEMDALLGPVFGDGEDEENPVGKALEMLAAESLTETDGLGSGLLLLLDTELMDLPFEMLCSLRRRNLRPIGRDFSVHVLANRFNTASTEAKLPVEVENSEFSFVVDPRCEDNGSTNKNNPRSSILEVFHEELKGGSLDVAKSWKGVDGNDRIVSDGEWQNILRSRSSGGFMFYGPGSVLSHLAPKKLAGLNASGCRLVVLADRMDNEVSFRRKSKIDNMKSSTDLALERPLETVALWTLAGAGSVITNQWASSFQANARLVKRLFQNLYEKDVSAC